MMQGVCELQFLAQEWLVPVAQAQETQVKSVEIRAFLLGRRIGSLPVPSSSGSVNKLAACSTSGL